MKRQAELVCTNCPLLPDCDEQSLWCMFRLLTKPNAAQREFVNNRVMIRKTARAKHDAKWYEANREKKIAAVLKRYHAKKRENGAGPITTIAD